MADAMTEGDKELLRVGWGVGNPEQGLLLALRISPLCWSAFLENEDEMDGEIVAVFGCADGEEPGLGVPWLVTGRGIERVKLRFVRQSLNYAAKIFERYEVLVCHAHKENTALVGWIRWLGFETEDLGNGFVRGVLDKCAYRRR
jgi:hypothetical protein